MQNFFKPQNVPLDTYKCSLDNRKFLTKSPKKFLKFQIFFEKLKMFPWTRRNEF